MSEAGPSHSESGANATGSPLVLIIAALLLRRWRIVFGIPLLAGAIAVVISYLVPYRYSASVSLAPSARRGGLQLSGVLAGVASQFLPELGGDAVQSPGFYVQVLQSRELMTEVLRSRYARPGGGDSATLFELIKPGGATPAESLERAIKKLGNATAITADNQTSILRVTVESIDRELSAEVANQYQVQLNAFNLRSGREQARQRRIFVEERRDEVAAELQAAEDRVQAFLRNNRSYENDPGLQFQYSRLQRQLQLRQEMYLTLSRAYENMRAEESNTVPALTVIDRAVPPAYRSSPARRTWLMMTVFFTATLLAAVAAALFYRDQLRARDPAGYREVADLWGALRADLKLPGRRAGPTGA